MINVLFIHQSAELYGSDKTLLLLLTKLDKSRFNPIVVIPFDGPLKEELEKKNIKVVITPVLKLYRKMFTPKNIVSFLKQIKKSVSILDKLNEVHKFDLIYSNTLAVLLGMIYAKKRGVKHIWHVHEIIVHPKIIAAIFPKLLNSFSDLVVCNSNATKYNLVKRKKELEKKAIVIYNGLEQNSPLKDFISREDFGFNSDDIIVTLVGRISRLKGHKLMLDVFMSRFSKKGTIKLLFVGSPVIGQEYYLEEIKNSILKNKMDNQVKMLPFTKDLNSIWQVSDIVVLPSTEAESFGLVAVEAMLAGKPVVASNHGGPTEIVLDNETGFLFEPNNENSLAMALEKLIYNPELRKTFGAKGNQRAKEVFSLDSHVQHFEKIFEELLENKDLS
jgi:glycosyltransferase involved in cell wall biosynthesis